MKDFSGKGLSRKTNKIVLITNVVLLVLALSIGVVSVYYHETVTWVGMVCVILVSVINIVVSWKRLRGKNI